MGTVAVQYMSYERYPKKSHDGVFGSSFITAGFAVKTADLAVRVPICMAGARGLHEAGGAQSGEASRRSAKQPNMENLSSWRAKGRIRHAAGKADPQFRFRRGGAWNANLEEG
jgi:hypothetical protein